MVSEFKNDVNSEHVLHIVNIENKSIQTIYKVEQFGKIDIIPDTSQILIPDGKHHKKGDKRCTILDYKKGTETIIAPQLSYDSSTTQIIVKAKGISKGFILGLATRDYSKPYEEGFECIKFDEEYKEVARVTHSGGWLNGFTYDEASKMLYTCDGSEENIIIRAWKL
jgi:hypothetical protein